MFYFIGILITAAVVAVLSIICIHVGGPIRYNNKDIRLALYAGVLVLCFLIGGTIALYYGAPLDDELNHIKTLTSPAHDGATCPNCGKENCVYVHIYYDKDGTEYHGDPKDYDGELYAWGSCSDCGAHWKIHLSHGEIIGGDLIDGDPINYGDVLESSKYYI